MNTVIDVVKVVSVASALALAACGHDFKGKDGKDGQDGATGSVGPQGQTGAPGLNAPSVDFVQLCPNIAVSYPSSFPEQAICSQGNLYGVYWDGSHAFLALLPPGDYSSTSPQGCNLTVMPNCQIRN